jgi:hypothetical protein
MDRLELDSSNIGSIGYDPDSKVLEVEFAARDPDGVFLDPDNNRIYHYLNVPEEIYEGFLEADSPGGYLYLKVKGEFIYKYLGYAIDLSDSK